MTAIASSMLAEIAKVQRRAPEASSLLGVRPAGSAEGLSALGDRLDSEDRMIRFVEFRSCPFRPGSTTSCHEAAEC
jgi:hypothetical protein